MKPLFNFLLIFFFPVILLSQTTFTIRKYTGPDLDGVSMQGIVEAPDGTIYIYRSGFGGAEIFRYVEEEDTLKKVDCKDCDRISDLTVGWDGALYVAAQLDGLIRLTDSTEEELLSGRVEQVAVGPDGLIYVVDDDDSNTGDLMKFQGGEWTGYNMDNSALTTNRMFDLAVDTNGVLWIGTEDGLFSYDGSLFDYKPGLERSIFNIYFSPAHEVWVRPSNAKPRRWTGTAFEDFDSHFPPTLPEMQAFDLTSDGVLYAAHSQAGLFVDDFMGATAVQIDWHDLDIETESPFIRRLLIDQKDRIWITGDLPYVLRLEVEDNTTSTRDFTVLPLEVFPNPATDHINIQIPQDLIPQHTLLQVSDLSGKIILKSYLYTEVWPLSQLAGKNGLSPAIKGNGFFFTIPTHSWPVGNYQITLGTGDKIYGSQVVKAN